MKKILLGRGGVKTEVTIMNKDEYIKFMKHKVIYHHVCGWIEKWSPSTGIDKEMEYFPSSGFTLSSRVTLKRYPYVGYSEKCLHCFSTTGKFYQDYVGFKVTIRRTKKSILYYVTKAF